MDSQGTAPNDDQLLRLRSMLAQLPEDQRRVLELRYLNGCLLSEICSQTGYSRRFAVEMLYRGTKSLRALADRT